MSEKLKNLLSILPSGSVAPKKWLLSHGFSSSNIQKYTKGGWLKKIGSGAYIKYKDAVSVEGVLSGLQKAYPGIYYLGAKTALDLHGNAHNVSQNYNELVVCSNWLRKPASWLFSSLSDHKLLLHHSHCLRADLGLTMVTINNIQIPIAGRERAALEMADLLDLVYSFQEIKYIFEGLATLRPSMIQNLLENYKSVKAKRVFLLMGKNLDHFWYKELDLGKIDIGQGARQLVVGGIYDPELKITYPKDLFDDPASL